MTLDAVEFIRRFLLHVLPSGLVRIRHFGFLANRVRKKKLEHCRALLAASAAPIPIDPDCATSVEDPHCCPICKLGRLVVIEVIRVESTAVQDTSGSAQRTQSSPQPVPIGTSADLCLPSLHQLPEACPQRLGARVFRSGSPALTFHRAVSGASLRAISRKNPFNTQQLVPAPFNEFYPKRSGPTIPALHAILPPEHFR